MTWLLKTKRFETHSLGSKPRTYSSYELFIGGTLRQSGFMCEPIGPSSSYTKKVRISAGLYRLQFHFGTKYKTIGFDNTKYPSQNLSMPAIGLEDRGTRDFILIHPAHEPTLYLSSIGCLNPTKAIRPHENMDFLESRERVIALINSLKEFSPEAFKDPKDKQLIPGALIIIEDCF